MSTSFVGVVPTPSLNGVTSWDGSSSTEDRVPYMEYAKAILITEEPVALFPPALAVKGGTFRALSVYKMRGAHVSSALSALVLLKATISASSNSSPKP